MNDPSKAYKFILPEATAKCERLKEEMEYFTN